MTDADWQPIETAPKDGTRIVVFRPNFDSDYIPQVGLDYWGFFAGHHCWAKSRVDCPPTLWQPLPALPSPPAHLRTVKGEGKL